MNPDRPLRFVHLQKPGQKYELEEHKAVRKHVRRAIVREKKSRHIDQNIRVFTPSNWSMRKSRSQTKPEGSTEAKSPRSIVHASPGAQCSPASEHLCIEEDFLPRAACQDEFLEGLLEFARKGDVVGSTLLMNPTFHHPFTASAAKLVDLPECRIDELFKSDVFKVVGEPCFDTSQIDDNRNIDLVFPSSLSDPVFMHTLIYSMLRIQHQRQPSLETLTFERTTIQLLNHAIANSGDRLPIPLIGAIMLSTANAWRTGDVVVHRAHSSGLWQALRLASKVSGSPLSPEATRAVFWLDLLSSVSMGSQRRASHLTLPSQPQWSRSKLPADLNAASHLPVGFHRHRSVIPDDLLDCLEDIVELQSTMANPVYRRDYLILDDMQASIESRLSFQARACQRFGEISEIIRLAAFICCYCCWTDTWNSNFVPARVANELAGLLEASIAMGRERLAEVWSNHIEILLWVLFVGASVSENERQYTEGLKQRYANLMRRIGDGISSSEEDVSLALCHSVKSTLDQFLYCEDWIEKRAQMREWFALEIQLDAKFTCQNDARALYRSRYST